MGIPAGQPGLFANAHQDRPTPVRHIKGLAVPEVERF
jgi:hypothetical protein